MELNPERGIAKSSETFIERGAEKKHKSRQLSVIAK